jgi:uncharacterized membrane protein
MTHYIYAFLISIATMTVLDAGWLGYFAPRFYRKHIGFILADKPDFVAAAAFYLIYILGLTVFVVYPGWNNLDSVLHIIGLGALYGLVTYATYDLTNQSTVKNWPLKVTIVDMLWGTFLTSVVSIVAVSTLKALIG